MKNFMSVCRMHPPFPIITVCTSPPHPTPLCARCLNDHIHSHHQSQNKCFLIDSQRFIQTYDPLRLKTMRDLQKSLTELARTEESSRNYVKTAVKVVEDAKRSLIKVIEQSFEEMREQVEKEVEAAVRIGLEEVNRKRREVGEGMARVRGAVGVEGLIGYLREQGEWNGVVQDVQKIVRGTILPQCRISKSLEDDVKEILDSCLEVVGKQKDNCALAFMKTTGSTWLQDSRKGLAESVKLKASIVIQTGNNSYISQEQAKKQTSLVQNLQMSNNLSSNMPNNTSFVFQQLKQLSSQQPPQSPPKTSRQVLGMRYVTHPCSHSPPPVPLPTSLPRPATPRPFTTLNTSTPSYLQSKLPVPLILSQALKLQQFKSQTLKSITYPSQSECISFTDSVFIK